MNFFKSLDQKHFPLSIGEFYEMNHNGKKTTVPRTIIINPYEFMNQRDSIITNVNNGILVKNNNKEMFIEILKDKTIILHFEKFQGQIFHKFKDCCK